MNKDKKNLDLFFKLSVRTNKKLFAIAMFIFAVGCNDNHQMSNSNNQNPKQSSQPSFNRFAVDFKKVEGDWILEQVGSSHRQGKGFPYLSIKDGNIILNSTAHKNAKFLGSQYDIENQIYQWGRFHSENPGMPTVGKFYAKGLAGYTNRVFWDFSHSYIDFLSTTIARVCFDSEFSFTNEYSSKEYYLSRYFDPNGDNIHQALLEMIFLKSEKCSTIEKESFTEKTKEAFFKTVREKIKHNNEEIFEYQDSNGTKVVKKSNEDVVVDENFLNLFYQNLALPIFEEIFLKIRKVHGEKSQWNLENTYVPIDVDKITSDSEKTDARIKNNENFYEHERNQAQKIFDYLGCEKNLEDIQARKCRMDKAADFSKSILDKVSVKFKLQLVRSSDDKLYFDLIAYFNSQQFGFTESSKDNKARLLFFLADINDVYLSDFLEFLFNRYAPETYGQEQKKVFLVRLDSEKSKQLQDATEQNSETKSWIESMADGVWELKVIENNRTSCGTGWSPSYRKPGKPRYTGGPTDEPDSKCSLTPKKLIKKDGRLYNSFGTEIRHVEGFQSPHHVYLFADDKDCLDGEGSSLDARVLQNLLLTPGIFVPANEPKVWNKDANSNDQIFYLGGGLETWLPSNLHQQKKHKLFTAKDDFIAINPRVWEDFIYVRKK